jgi:hypothetical protein
MVEEDGTRSIGEIAQKLVISSRSVHRVLKDYPIRRNFCVWLLNKAAEYEILFRGSCFRTNQVLVGRAIYPRAFQRRFSVNLWAGLVGDSVASHDCKK